MRINETQLFEKFGEKIRSLRKNKGLSQEELAHLSDLDRTYIGSVERGERNISLKNIYKLSIALEIKLEKLFDDITSQHQENIRDHKRIKERKGYNR